MDNRLTKTNGHGGVWLAADDPSEFNGYSTVTTRVLCRLAAYEDTGLPPEHVAELAKAERDGRTLPEGFDCVESCDGVTLYVFHGEGRRVMADVRYDLSPSTDAALRKGGAGQREMPISDS